MFKIKNYDTKTMLMSWFWCLYCCHWTYTGNRVKFVFLVIYSLQSNFQSRQIWPNLLVKSLFKVKYHNRHVLVQNQQWRHQNMWNLFKVGNNDTRTWSLTSFWCLNRQFWTYFTHCSGVSIIDFDQVNAGYISD